MPTTIDLGTQDVFCTVDDGVATLTLNRPDRRNAFSPAMLLGLEEAVRTIQVADDIGAVILTGAGGAFCAGGDVKEFAENDGEGGDADHVDQRRVAKQRREQRAIVAGLYRLPMPVVAAIPGAVAGAGIGLALAADLRITGERGFFVAGFAGVGLSGDYGAAWLLTSLLGPSRAREFLLLGDRLSAQRALEFGLVNSVVPDEQLSTVAAEWAHRLANGPRVALALMKKNLLEAPALSLEESMDAEVPRHHEAGLTGDHREAVQAFVAKRTPLFGSARR